MRVQEKFPLTIPLGEGAIAASNAHPPVDCERPRRSNCALRTESTGMSHIWVQGSPRELGRDRGEADHTTAQADDREMVSIPVGSYGDWVRIHMRPRIQLGFVSNAVIPDALSAILLMDTTTPSQPHQTEDSLRLKKRKLRDAFQTLDDAVQGPGQPPPSKKTHISRSIYSTLEKYGIKSKSSKSTPTPTRNTAPELGSKTPHLSAILSRVATKAKNAFSFKFSPDSQPLPASAEYRPSSLQSFLSRLESFKLSTYSNKPSSIDAVAASRCGWTNDGRDRLVCGFCHASWVVVGRERMNRDAANALIEKQRQGLVDNHKNGCPWKTRQCDPSIYCVPLGTPTAMVKDLKAIAYNLDPLVGDIGIRHPLTPNQLASLKKTLTYQSFRTQAPELLKDGMDVDESSNEDTPELSDAAILVSVFGWTLVPPVPMAENPRRISTSASISVSRSVSRCGTPSRASSRRSSLSMPGHSPGSGVKKSVFTVSLFTKRENAMLQCSLCQRRVGLWAFTPRKTEESTVVTSAAHPTGNTDSASSPARPKKPLPQRQFDLLKEHRSYCPYVIKSTMVPSLPRASDLKFTLINSHIQSTSSVSHHNLATTNGAIEGWRAVLTVVLRYGMAQRHRTEYDVLAQSDANGNNAATSTEVDTVKAMVAGVKEQGGSELMKYVKGLLG